MLVGVVNDNTSCSSSGDVQLALITSEVALYNFCAESKKLHC